MSQDEAAAAALVVVERIKVHPGSAEFQDVCDFFNSKSQAPGRALQVVSVERVHNAVLEQRFKDKTHEYKQAYGQVRVIRAWHGTKKLNVAPILKNNFDVVCKHGQGGGPRFGAGVSFSSSAGHAAQFCDKTSSACMLLANVLVSNVAEASESGGAARDPPFLPGRYPLRYDTTAKNKAVLDELVKFDKDAFLPTHVVHFRRDAAGPVGCGYDEEEDDDDEDGAFSDTDSDYQVDDNFDDFVDFYGSCLKNGEDEYD